METQTRGRPRDPARDRAILGAARQVMARRGYTGCTMEEVAKTAGVGKDTLYRRWTSKDQLAIGLIDSMATEAVKPKPLDPDPRYNLFVFLKDIVRLNATTEFGALAAGIVGEAARNDELAKSFHAFWDRRRAIAASLVTDVVGSDHSEATVAELLDGLLGPIYYRLFLTGATISDEYLWSLVAALPDAPSLPTNSPQTRNVEVTTMTNTTMTNTTSGQHAKREHLLTIVEPTVGGDETLTLAHDTIERGGGASIVMMITDRVRRDIAEYAQSEGMSRLDAEGKALDQLSADCLGKVGGDATIMMTTSNVTDVERLVTDDTTAIAVPERLMTDRSVRKLAKTTGLPVIVTPSPRAA